MEDLSQTLLQFSPKLRDQKEGETTPEYLNYINKNIIKHNNYYFYLN